MHPHDKLFPAIAVKSIASSSSCNSSVVFPCIGGIFVLGVGSVSLARFSLAALTFFGMATWICNAC